MGKLIVILLVLLTGCYNIDDRLKDVEQPIILIEKQKTTVVIGNGKTFINLSDSLGRNIAKNYEPGDTINLKKVSAYETGN